MSESGESKKDEGILDTGIFYEMEYASSPAPGIERLVSGLQKIPPPIRDARREIFSQMRDIARKYRLGPNYPRSFDQKLQGDNGIIFYKQGMFMRDFSDDYSGHAGFARYFPFYQMMGYEQLRTYFTWRTAVRKGSVREISPAYAFLYVYELLANIGADDPADGLAKLLFFWRAFSAYDNTLDKYIFRWLKDYHIYYELPLSFREFTEKNNLTGHYPELAATGNPGDDFDLLCGISKYDLRASAFFTAGNGELIKDCFYFVTDRLRQVFRDKGEDFDGYIFQSPQRMSAWAPFRDALFYQWLRQPDRRVILSPREIYICRQNKWIFSPVITTESGRLLLGYIMRQMESALRAAAKYKFKLRAGIHSLAPSSGAAPPDAADKLAGAGLSLENVINGGVREFYREATQTVVKLDPDALASIRREALVTQERLLVPEGEAGSGAVAAAVAFALPPKLVPEQTPSATPEATLLPVAAPPELAPVPELPAAAAAAAVAPAQTPAPASESELPPPTPPPTPAPESPPAAAAGIWASLQAALTETELQALAALAQGEQDIREFAGARGVLPEVLLDGINGKALDIIGDSLTDAEFVLYSDYKDQVKELVR
jgi:hypothetical protein